MKKIIISTFTLILVMVLMQSCNEDELLEQDLNATNESLNDTKLGEKLENPFSVENMRKALESLRKTNQRYADSNFEIVATHLYMRYKPEDELQLNILEKDSTLELYEYPLDYQIPEGLTSYHDKSIPRNKPTFQYCAVPVDYDFPYDIEYEILEQLYLPDEDIRANSRENPSLLYD
jgi:hypothetical protein